MANNAGIPDLPPVSLHGSRDWCSQKLAMSSHLLRRLGIIHRGHLLVAVWSLSRYIRRRC